MSTTQTLGGSSLTSAALGQALAASNASLLSANPSVLGSGTAGSDVASTSSQLSNALAKLAIAQQQQQAQQQAQQQQFQQQVVAANAMLQAASTASSSSLLPSVASNLSIGNLRSTSVASSVMSGMQPTSQLEPIPSAAPLSGGRAVLSGAKVSQ
jgi:ABC-type transport system involved in cytochrome bd biosynthesis fused ATPase/permease subunit